MKKFSAVYGIWKRNRRTATAVLAVLSVIATAYVLTVPAVTITDDAATPEAGFFEEGEQTQPAAPAAAEEPEPAVEPEPEPAVEPEPEPAEPEADPAEGESAEPSEGAAAEDAGEEPAQVEENPAPSGSVGDPAETSDDSAADPELLRQKLDLGDGTFMEIRVEDPDRILPEGTRLEAGGIDPEKIDSTLELMKAKAEEKEGISSDYSGVIAADLKLVDADGNEVEPGGKVSVTVTCPAIERDAQFAMVRVKYAEPDEDHNGINDVDEGKEEPKDRASIVPLKEADPDGHAVKFQAKELGPYGLVYIPPVEDELDEDVDETEEVEGAGEEGDGEDGIVAEDEPDAVELTPENAHAQSFSETVEAADGTLVSVVVDADECTFPDGTTMHVEAVESQDVLDAARSGAADGTDMAPEDMSVLAADITFLDAEGNEIEPAKPVHVAMVAQDASEFSQAAIVHVDDEQVATLVEDAEPHANLGAVYFDADAFSVYAMVYTVDFHWEIDGRVYQFSMPGGGYVGLEALVEVLGVARAEQGDSVDEAAESEQSDSSDFEGEIAEDAQPDSTDETADEFATDISAAEPADAEEAGAEDAQVAEDAQATVALTLGDVSISDETKKFVADVESVEFSSPELVWVGKADDETTVGSLKEGNGLDCQYSSELTEDQIAQIDAQTVDAGDWALIGLQPFLSEETLTVTMKTGEVFTIRVTDGQLHTFVLTDEGEIYKVTVTYNESAGIPDDAELVTRQYSEDEKEYRDAKEAVEGFQKETVEETQEETVEEPESDSISETETDAESAEADVAGESLEADADAESAEADAEAVSEASDGGLLEDDQTKISLPEEDISMLAFDIAIHDSEGNVIEPKSQVAVSIELFKLPEGSDFELLGKSMEVHHLVKTEGEDAESAVLVADVGGFSKGTVDVEEEKAVAEFVTDSFSTYTISWGNGTNQHVTLHFVNESGQELNNVTYNGTPIDGGQVIINPSNPSSFLQFDSDGKLDLSAFTVDGMTLSSTHRGTPNDILPGVSKPTTSPYTNAQQPHSIIGNELKWSGNNIQYHYFYTNSDKAGDVWMDAGYRPTQSDIDDGSNLVPNPAPVYDGNISYNGYTTYDYFLVYSPDYVDSGHNGGEHGTTPDLGDVKEDKQLTSNEDGTYTLDLSVTAEAKKDEKFNDINIILVLDTSSSMRRDSQDRRPGDSGYDGTTRRMILTANAIEQFVNNLKPNNTTENPDAVQMKLITFNAYASEQVQFTTDLDSIVTKVWDLNGGRTQTGTADSLSQGTNWADGLRLAKETAINDEDPTFVLFLTDGAPSEYWPQASAPGGSLLFVDGGGSYLGAREEGRALASTGREFYGVFSFGTATDQQNDYLGELLDYSYQANVRGDRGFYAQDGDELLAYLNQILAVVNESIGHTGVNYHDGIALDTASTALKTGGVDGTIGGITYSKVGGTSPNYSVVAKSDGTVESFIVGGAPDDNGKWTGGTDYGANSSINTEFAYKKISGDSPNITVTDETATVYQCTVGSGDGAVTYTMPTVSLAIDEDTQIGDLNWDLSPLGMLEDGATYTVSFVVWPDQEAYNYVADLNNGFAKWGVDSTPEPVYDGEDNLLYYKNGVKDYPNIVFYPGPEDHPEEGYYAALTNTSQDVTYYVEDQITNEEPTYTGPGTHYPPTPNPMPLTATESEIEKAWSVERNPGIMAQLLYDENGDPTEFSIDYALYYDDNDEPYKKMTLGWNGTEYDWDSDSVRYVTYKGNRVPIGTRWTKDFDIATGLMLSEARMDELGLDKSDSRYKEYSYGTTKYYILETGHDYKIEEIVPQEEKSWLTYDFDFISPDYHPMLVDGKLKNVIFEKDGDTITAIKEISKDEWLASLKIENTLRGYICLDKVVVDQDGETPVPEDNTKFEYRIELHNSTDPGPFTVEGSHVPWFGINDLFYHGEDWSYYQAEVYNAPDPDYPNRSHYLTITTESGAVYDARCTDSEGNGWDDESLVFDEDITGPTWVTYRDEANGQDVTIQLYGNQMTHVSDNYVWAELKISQNEYLSVANVPVGTTYIVTEKDDPRYELVGTAMPSGATLSGATVSGTIIPDSDNHITYTNKSHSAAVIVKKVDDNGMALDGASFTLTRTGVPSGMDPSDYDNGVEKPADEEADTGTYTFENLPDGTYTLAETATPPGFTGMASDITFTVSGGIVLSEGMAKPGNVEWNGDEYTFTVPNTPTDSGLTVRKQWLDYYGNPEASGADDITLTLKRRIEPQMGKKLKVVVNAQTTRGTIKLEKEILIQNTAYTVSWNDNGEFQWVGDRLKRNGSPSKNDNAVTVTDGIGNNNHGDPVQHNNNKKAIWNVTGLGNATEDTVVITFTYSQSTASWDTYLSSADFYNALSNADITFTPTGSTIEVETGEPVEDEEWSQEVTLNEGKNWRETISNLPTSSEDGGTYRYYIVEETVPEGYTVSYSNNNEEGITSGVLTAYNRNNTGVGSLHITKTILKNGIMDTSAKGTFYYAVYDEAYDSGADPAQEPVKHGAIEVAEFGSATVTVDNLPIGKYYVYELDGPFGDGGKPVISGEEGFANNGRYYDVATTGSQAVINENDPPTVHIKNNYETVRFPVEKSWVGGSWPNEVESVTATLYQSVDGAEATQVTPAKTLTLTSDESRQIFTDLPKYDGDGNPIAYSVKETAITLNVGGHPVVLKLEPGEGELGITDLYEEPAVETAANGAVTITNEKKFGKIEATKTWADDLPHSSVSFRLFRNGWYMNGDQKVYLGGDWYPSATTSYEIPNNGTGEVDNLPISEVLMEGSTPKLVTYEYTVVEIPVPGYTASYDKDSIDFTSDEYKETLKAVETITNTPVGRPDHTTGIDVSKIWKSPDGTDASANHAQDQIEFKLTQKKVDSGYVPVTVTYTSRAQSPTTENIYVPKGSTLTFTFEKGQTSAANHHVQVTYTGFDTEVGGKNETYTVTTNAINQETAINVNLSWKDDRWGETVQELPHNAYQWTHGVTASGGTIYNDYDAFKAAMLEKTDFTNGDVTVYILGRASITADTDAFASYHDGTVENWAESFTGLPELRAVGTGSDVNYEFCTYEISELKIIPQNGSPEEVTYADGVGTSDHYMVTIDGGEITNTENNETDFHFTKRWMDQHVGGASPVEWPDDKQITVTVTRTLEEMVDTQFSLVYTIQKSDLVPDGSIAADASSSLPADMDSAPVLKVESVAGNNYGFLLEGLPEKSQDGTQYVYSVSETGVPDGCEPPKYFNVDGNVETQTANGVSHVENNGIIQNEIAYYALPHTGGPGTHLFTIFGAALAVLAMVGFAMTRKRRKSAA